MIDLEVKLGQNLDGFPNTDVWNQYPALELAYRRTVADRVNVELKWVGNVTVANIFDDSRRRRLQTVTGISTEVAVSIPNPESGATQDEVTAGIAAALSDTGDDANAETFLESFVAEVELVSEEAANSGDTALQMPPTALEDSVKRVAAIEVKPVEVTASIMTAKPTSHPTSMPSSRPTLTYKPSSLPTTGPTKTPTPDDNSSVEDDDDSGALIGAIVGGIVGGLLIFGGGVYFVMNQANLKTVMPVGTLDREDVGSASIVPGSG